MNTFDKFPDFEIIVPTQLQNMFKDKTLLITGGTGSFGNAVLERFLDTDIGEIRIFSRDEKKQDDMRKLYNNSKIKFYIGDVRDIRAVREAAHGVDFIFHAAALKQVPSCEFFPMEAVKTNVIGTDNVLTAAIEAGVKKVICLSTDKAAYPVNAMGTSKAMMEKVFVAKSRTAKNTLICGTRYGNVMCSRGSVIPLFIDQIKAGAPLTITEASMTRYIMSLEEAVELVVFAFENAKPGDIMVQKAPACTIGDLAQALKELFNDLGYDGSGENAIRAVIDDRILKGTVSPIESNLALLQGLYLLFFAVIAMIGFFISFLLARGRKPEYAVMRTLGESRTQITAKAILEQGTLCLVGIMIGSILVALTGLGRPDVLGSVLILLCYTSGAAVAVLLTVRVNVMDILRDKE